MKGMHGDGDENSVSRLLCRSGISTDAVNWYYLVYISQSWISLASFTRSSKADLQIYMALKPHRKRETLMGMGAIGMM